MFEIVAKGMWSRCRTLRDLSEMDDEEVLVAILETDESMKTDDMESSGNRFQYLVGRTALA